MGSCHLEVEHWVTGRQLLQEPEAMAEQCLAASRPAIDCHLLRNFLAFLTPLGMAAAVLSFTWKVAGKTTKLIWFWSLEWPKKQNNFLNQKTFFQGSSIDCKYCCTACTLLCGSFWEAPAGPRQQEQWDSTTRMSIPPALTSVEPHVAPLGSRRTSALYVVWWQRSHQHLTGSRSFSSTERS